ncbi:receptor-like protein 13 [Abrus precatorius]|uniref:Receptor-like protein 13 n=1 Tax=Abrus precatorius TaxID=3816 RepID=A0A8B8MLI4_ABRPR|nr:receptor-like protein 13 [Abrus precatorius]
MADSTYCSRCGEASKSIAHVLQDYFHARQQVRGSKGCLEKERVGLLEIKDYFHVRYNFPTWNASDSNCCGWSGVVCDQPTGRVTDLLLESLHSDQKVMNFSLLLPFQQLEYLDLSDNYFNGSVVIEGLCGLKNLLELDMSHNFISSLPKCMSNLTSLTVLDISSTTLTGKFPSFITSLNSLKYFSLFDSNVDGSFSFNLLVNHSKLEVFLLSSVAHNLHVETESSPWLPTFQLKALQLGNCNLDSIPSFLLYQHELRLLDLSRNKLHGEFPTWILNNNLKLETLRLASNMFTGTLQLPTSQHGLLNLRISSNKFGGQIPKSFGSIFPNLSYVNLAQNNFEGRLPSSMVEMLRVKILDLSNNKLSGEFPKHFFSNWSSLILLNLSHNNFSGRVIPKFSHHAKLNFLFLNNNHLGGKLEDGIFDKSSLIAMDISSNMVSGRIPRWISNFTSLKLLSMSKNLLKAEVPIEMCSLVVIEYLDLSENSLSGSLPECLLHMDLLRFLHLQKNALKGFMPNNISDILYSLDLRDNEFYGQIPDVMFSNFAQLRYLLLGGNELNGSIPITLCDLNELRIVDLSRNRLTGIIPSCLAYNSFAVDPMDGCQALTSIFLCVGNREPLQSDWYILEQSDTSFNTGLVLNKNSLDDVYLIIQPQPAEFRTKNNIYYYTGNILELMSGLDLSCNELSGSIPPEIGFLGNINALNLSHNHLSGTIPQSFSNLVKVESLDLSFNNLSGAIPSNLTMLYFLAIFNVSYNNLSGSTPTAGQFASFGVDNYKGNPGLIFSPFNTILSPLHTSPDIQRYEGENCTTIELVSFYWGFVISLFTVLLEWSLLSI